MLAALLLAALQVSDFVALDDVIGQFKRRSTYLVQAAIADARR